MLRMLDLSSSAARAGAYLVLALLAVVLVASHTPVGAALTMDSLYYLSAAGNILDGNGITHSTHALSGPALEATTLWPPLYPVLVAAIQWLANMAGTSDVVGIAVFNVLALIASSYLIVRIASLTASAQAGMVVAIAVIISPSIQIVFTYAWSEALFIPLSLAAYLSLYQYLFGDERVRQRWLYAMVMFLGLATYTRYVGLAFFSSAALAILLYERRDVFKRLRTVAAVTLAYLAFLSPMLLRNLAETGSFSGGDRGSPDISVLSDISTLMWYLYLEFLNLPLVIGGVFFLVTLALAAWLLLRHAGSIKQASPSFGLPSIIIIPFLFVFAYMALLLISRGRQNIDLDSRMLSVVVPFLLIGLLGVYQQLLLRVGNRLAILPFLLPLAAFAMGAIHTHTSILKGWRDFGEPGLILGQRYPSMTGRQLDSLRSIGKYFAPGAGDLVLTDVSRPIMVEHLLPEADVRQLPSMPDDQNMRELEVFLQRKGVAIIDRTDWSKALSKSLDGRADFYSVDGGAESPNYVVITLPVDAK